MICFITKENWNKCFSNGIKQSSILDIIDDCTDWW
jgi:hypothetical protein